MRRIWIRRPVLVKALAAIHLVMGLACLWGAVVVVRLMHSPETLASKDPAAVIAGYKIATIAAAVTGVIYVVVAFGIWLKYVWAWWLALTLNALAAVALEWDWLFERQRFDTENAPFAALMIAIDVLLLLPCVRRFMTRRVRRRVLPGAGEIVIGQ